MRRLSALCLSGGGGGGRGRPRSSRAHARPDPKETQNSMAEPQSSSANVGGGHKPVDMSGQIATEIVVNSQSAPTNNIISNHDFSEGLHSWHPNCCDAYVVSGESSILNEVAANSGSCYAVITKRTECWQGLEQDITEKISPGFTYVLSACVRIWGALEGPTGVQATLKLEYPDSPTRYLSVGRVSVSKERWVDLEGSFSLTSMPKRVVLYLEGPPPGVDLLIDSIMVFCPSIKQCEEASTTSVADGEENIIQNSNFEDGLNNWSGRGCKILLHDSMGDGKILPLSGKVFASATERTQNWNGIQQEITGRVQRKRAYEVTAVVRIFGSTTDGDVRATLWVQSPNGREQYIGIANIQASNKEWVQLKGKFLLNGTPSRVVIYLEGPASGTDILVNSLVVKHAEKLPPLPPPDTAGTRETMVVSKRDLSTNIILNHDFSEGLHSWHPNSCSGYVISGESKSSGGLTARSGRTYAVISNRTECWQGLEQDITDRVSPGSSYSTSAWISVWGTIQETSEVLATLKLEYQDSPTSYLSAGRVLATKEQWVKLEGSFSLTSMPNRVVFFLEGPSPGMDLLIDSVKVTSGSQKLHADILFGDNIIENSTLNNGLNGWYPLGSCTLKVCTGSPHLLPSTARDSLGQQKPLSGHYLLATNRTETWMGPAQTVTERLKLHWTYQVSAWVRVGRGASGPQTINLALGVDNQWVNGGQAEANDDRWHELAGSFRIERQPSKVIVYVQGPSSGVDLMVAGLQIFPVDRKMRFRHLKEQTDKVRKRGVILKFSGSNIQNLFGTSVKVRQMKNSFPFGSCINRSEIDNEDFVEFFVKNFNWAVFGNELKWYHTEPQQGKFNYTEADEMLDFCQRHGIETRGHCIFWEVEDAVQSWVRSLGRDALMTAIQNRLTSLLSRYRGRFRHYDVNNEMLHGSFYRDRLGRDIWSYMFKAAHQIDPSSTLFVNDYHIEDGRDSKSSPEKYIQQILDLQEQGAPVGGIGIQGHIHHPVGPVICSALDKLAILGLPIWFTELDVSAVNEHVRADDLEVILREAYAHPAVEGIVLWGFWETLMCSEHSHWVDAEGDVNEAGKRYLALKQEWLSDADGLIDDLGEFRFRGYHGTYNLEIATRSKTSSRTFVVDKGESPLVLNINL